MNKITSATEECVKNPRSKTPLPFTELLDDDSLFPSDDEIDFINERFIYSDPDELPAFDISSISPIESGCESATASDSYLSDNLSVMSLNSTISTSREEQQILGLVPLKEINAQISSPTDRQSNRELETIFEGVFLDTPPKRRMNSWRIDITKAVVRSSSSSLDVENVQESVQYAGNVRKSVNSSREVYLKD